MELCPNGDSQARKWLENEFKCRFWAQICQGKNKPATWNEKKQLKLTSSQKAQSHMMVAKALLSWLPWTMTTSGREIIYNQWHVAWILNQSGVYYHMILEKERVLANRAIPVFYKECHSLWWWSLWRKSEQISPPSPIPFLSCRLSWSSWWTVKTRGWLGGRQAGSEASSSTNHVPECGTGALAGCIVF